MNSKTKIMKAIYVSVWDGGVEVRTSCYFNVENRLVTDIESSDVDGLDILEREYVELEDGTEITVFDFDTFNEKWIEQECECDEDQAQLENEIGECSDYDEMYDVIRKWSHKPATGRVAAMLVRNNACIIMDY